MLGRGGCWRGHPPRFWRPFGKSWENFVTATTDDRLMLTLLSMSVASRGRYTPDGRQFVRVEISEAERVEWEVLPAEIDELEARGWIELLPPRDGAPDDQAEVTLTEKANYWLHRWLKANRKRLPALLTSFAPGRRPDLAVEVHPVREGV